jgi:putative chitinase
MYKPMADAMLRFSIITPRRCAAFVAQVGHESAGLTIWSELWGPTEAQRGYEGRADLGNVQPGDGKLFHGRGPLQITGRAMYHDAGQALGVDLEADPDAVLRPGLGFAISGWIWRLKGCNPLADQHSLEGIRQITRRINGGMNGWDDRLRRWRLACAIWDLPILHEAEA